VVITMTDTELDDIIRDAITERRLLERAFVDAIETFAQATLCNRTTCESIKLLHNWAATFEKVRKRP
jgi:hypothetical protein